MFTGWQVQTGAVSMWAEGGANTAARHVGSEVSPTCRYKPQHTLLRFWFTVLPTDPVTYNRFMNEENNKWPERIVFHNKLEPRLT